MMHDAATVPSTSDFAVVRNLAPNASPLSTAIEALVEVNARLERIIKEDRQAARLIIGRIEENERRRLQLHALAAELEARLVKRPRRRNAA